MAYAKKIVLHLQSTNRPGLDALIEEFMRDGVRYVGVVGPDCALVEDLIDWICLGPCDGARPSYDMLTAWHENDPLEVAIKVAAQISGDYQGHSLGDQVQVVSIG